MIRSDSSQCVDHVEGESFFWENVRLQLLPAYIATYVRMCVYMSMSLSISVCVCVIVYAYVYVYVYMYVYVYVYVCMCIYVYAYLFIFANYINHTKSCKITLKFSGSEVVLGHTGMPHIIAYSTPINNKIRIQN